MPDDFSTTDLDKARKLREQADRYENSVSSPSGPSSQEYISPQRYDHYMRMAKEARDEANRLEVDHKSTN